MVQEENLYIKILKPLKKSEEDEIYKVWVDNIEEDIYYKKKAIKEYCDLKNYDYLKALNCILNKINDKYLVELAHKYTPIFPKYKIDKQDPEYFSKFRYETREEIRLSLKNIINNKQPKISSKVSVAAINELMKSIEEDGCATYNNEYFNVIFQGHDYGPNTITRKEVLDDIKEIELDIRNILKKRSPKPYINDTMEKEEEKYIKLFTPLQRKQKDMV